MTDSLWTCEGLTQRGRNRDRLSNISLSIPRGVTAIAGPSGSGKTTLLNLLVGFEKVDRGELKPRHDEATIWVPQDHGLWPHLTVEKHLLAVSPGKSEELVKALLSDFDLLHCAQAKPGTLSEGEKNRLALARALASEAKVLVMDEPLSHVDFMSAMKYWELIMAYVEQHDASLIFTTHQSEHIQAFADQLVYLNDGELVYSDPVSAIDTAPIQAQAAVLGYFNWVEEATWEHWFNGVETKARAVRPQEVEVLAVDTGETVLKQTRHLGHCQKSLLLNGEGQEAWFFHLPAKLKQGQRVALRLITMFVLCLLLFSACAEGDEPLLEPKEVENWVVSMYELDGKKFRPAPRAIALDENGDAYILDRAGRVVVMDKDGEELRHWWMPHYTVGRPEGICILENGLIAVADTHYFRVVVFDKEGKVQYMFGEKGEEPGDFIYPVGITTDNKGHIYVSEYGGNDRIQKFTLEGKFLMETGEHGIAEGEFQRPAGLVWDEGKLIVADGGNHRVQVFDENGKFLHNLPKNTEAYDLKMPYDIAKTADAIFLVEWQAGRLSKLSHDGKLIGRFGSIGKDYDQMITPWGIAVSADGKRVLIADTGNRRIVVLQW